MPVGDVRATRFRVVVQRLHALPQLCLLLVPIGHSELEFERRTLRYAFVFLVFYGAINEPPKARLRSSLKNENDG